MPTDVSAPLEDCAKAIYSLSTRTGGQPVSTNALAQRLDLAPATVTAMLKRLADQGLANHRPYHGVTLTAAGERVALEVIRHHRLLERFLVEELGLPWDRVHAEAEVLEHVLSEELEELIDRRLGHPTTDPHGDPIPAPDLVVVEVPTRSLDELEPGEACRFVRVSDADPVALRHLDDCGVGLGMEVRVVEREPFGGSLVVFVDGRCEPKNLGPDLARTMRVAPLEAAA